MRRSQSTYPFKSLVSVVACGLFAAMAGCGGSVETLEQSGAGGDPALDSDREDAWDDLGDMGGQLEALSGSFRGHDDDDEDGWGRRRRCNKRKDRCEDADEDAGPFDPTSVYVEKLRYRGDGCPRGSVAATVAPNGQSFTLLFSDFVAEAGPTVKRWERSSFCQVRLKLHVPKGYVGTVTTVDTRGFVQLDEGVVASQTSSYRFPGAQRTTESSSFQGPITDNYVRQDTIESETRSRCGEDIEARIDSALVVNNRANRAGSGLITVDTQDGLIRQVFNLEFEPCKCDSRGRRK